MGICPTELRDHVIRPTMKYLDEWSLAAENLLLGTAAQTSGVGFHLKRQECRALGIYQIDPLTHQNVWNKFLAYDPDLASRIRGLASQHEFLEHPHAELTTNLAYATAIAWMIYRRAKKPLPAHDDLDALARFWKRHYPTHNSCAPQEFINNYHFYIKDSLHDAA